MRAAPGSEAPLVGLSELGELGVDELLGVELCGLSSPNRPGPAAAGCAPP
jgi:hypothetical protein